jgi:DNA-cytosine methyltransferase
MPNSSFIPSKSLEESMIISIPDGQLEIDIPERNTSIKKQIFLVEDNTQCSARRSKLGVSDGETSILLRLHRINQDNVEIFAEKELKGSDIANGKRLSLARTQALKLIQLANPNPQSSIIVATTRYGCDQDFIGALCEVSLSFAVEIRPSTCLLFPENERKKVSDLVAKAKNWSRVQVVEPTTRKPIIYLVAELGVTVQGHCVFVAQRGGISGIHPSTIFGLTSIWNTNVVDLILAIGWSRWIRPIVRRRGKEGHTSTPSLKTPSRHSLNLKSNISTARQQDRAEVWQSQNETSFRGVLAKSWKQLNIAELFAGAGGIGLGFLMANRGQNPYRLIFSGEVHPIYAETLRQSHKAVSYIYHSGDTSVVPSLVEPLDLRADSALTTLQDCAKGRDGVQILIGGPPCQGFSSANRNSGDLRNPNNRLIDVFINYVERIKPAIALMENVQGIAWAKNHHKGKETLLDYYSQRMKKAGYLVFHQVLDAAEYGVPQFRWRFFALMIHRDLGYHQDDFGEWGPFPTPTHGPKASSDYVTVRQAISDLPVVGNGASQEFLPYTMPTAEALNSNHFLNLMRSETDPNVIGDHITSRHADYVISRYEAIPAGGNWQSIKEQMTNYADLNRTHSNIYRRLTWDDPSVTIGHYRKSMLVHPEQHRGLSFREAARLQSFPDWFPFSGNVNGHKGGLMHKQQQLANAVCPLLTKAVAELILKL